MPWGAAPDDGGGGDISPEAVQLSRWSPGDAAGLQLDWRKMGRRVSPTARRRRRSISMSTAASDFI